MSGCNLLEWCEIQVQLGVITLYASFSVTDVISVVQSKQNNSILIRNSENQFLPINSKYNLTYQFIY